MSLTDLSLGQFLTVSILLSSIRILWANTTQPKKQTLSLQKQHFLKWAYNPCFLKISNTHQTAFTWVYSGFFYIDQNVIQIHNDKSIEFFGQDLIDIFLETCQSIGQTKRDYLIFIVIISGLESRLLFVAFFDTYTLICAC